VHGEFHVFNPVFTKVVIDHDIVAVFEEISLRLVDILNEIVEVSPGDESSCFTVVLFPAGDKIINIQLLDR